VKITIEIEGKESQVIETAQYFLLSDKGCSYSGAYEWLKGMLFSKLEEIKTKEMVDIIVKRLLNINKEDRSVDTPRIQ